LKDKLAHSFSSNPLQWLYSSAFATIALVLMGFYTQQYILCLVPVLAIGIALTIINFGTVYYLMLASLPICVPVFIGSLSTDLPTEPLMAILMLCYFIFLFTQKNNSQKKYLQHPFIQIIILQFIWYVVVAIFSTVPLISIKYLLAKTWYITAFLLVTPLVIKEVKHFKTAFWLLFYPIFFVTIYTVYNHWQCGFQFDNSNMMSLPFYKNHVDYACGLSIFFPLLFVASSWYKQGDLKKIILQAAQVIFVFAIFVSYTRTAWLAIGLCLPVYFVIKWKLIKPALITASIGLVFFISFLTFENRYMQFAPDYKKTIMHHNLSDHLQSTETLNDVSSAERLYRWVAAWEMGKAKPLTGFGHGGFVANYKHYAVSLFTTYVSGNVEHSTVHNYLLFLFAEQGVIGLLLFLIICMLVLIKGEKIYHQTQNKTEKIIVMGLLISFVMVLFDNMLSDLIEAIKIGPFFYFTIALLVVQDLKNKKLQLITTTHELY